MSNFFFSLPAHLCAVTCMTEISLIVTLNNQFTSSLQYANNFPSKRSKGMHEQFTLTRSHN